MVDHSSMRLGKKRPVVSFGIPRLSAVLADDAPPAPAKCDWTGGQTSFGVMANDNLGDCTAAAIGHLYQIWTKNAYHEWTPTDSQVVSFYSESTGYDPSKPDTDQGGVETDVLNVLQKEGFCGRTIVGHASVDFKNRDAVKQAIYLAGGAYLGIQLPIKAQSQDIWNVPAFSWIDPKNKPGSWGGHAVCAVAYDDLYITFITWGGLKKATWPWFEKYADEAWVILAAAWVRNNKSPGGFDVPALQRYMLKKG